MTSPTLFEQPPLPFSPPVAQTVLRRSAVPALLFVVTMFTTTAVGMRYMHNFVAGQSPLGGDADVLPFVWMFHNLSSLTSGLPFSITLVGILLAHEFGHYFACRFSGVKATLPYLIPAPSLSGTFGAVIRLKSRVRTRAALIVIGAAGPVMGFVVALGTVTYGLMHSTYAAQPVMHRIQAPLLVALLQRALNDGQDLSLVVPHPVLVASWIGLLITALNLIPAGQLDGGHIVYAFSPRLHKVCSVIVIAGMFVLGILSWAGWLVWAGILMMPGMRHPKVQNEEQLGRGLMVLLPVCAVILIMCATYQPFQGYSVVDLFHKLPTRYR